jgi:hypothetical protein
MLRTVSIFALAFALASPACAPASADEMVEQPVYRHHVYRPRDRHVIEVVQPPWSGNFIINGTHFTGQGRACMRWAAGERIRLVSGDWHGQCAMAVFYNYRRRNRCEASCG